MSFASKLANFRFALWALLCTVALSSTVAAAKRWMGEEELMSTFSGVTIDGQYEDGRHFTESYRGDMALAYSEGPRETTGHWSVISDRFCTIYRGDPSGGCFRVTRIGENCFEFYFVARTEAQVRRRNEGKPGWTARGWIKGSPATCLDAPIV